ncbi:MAG: hypothetical protein NTY53_24635 [Kiritimatiellaeota bacterium]|nr:hypothetical protein [Kiritimatiellota bacterium]
MMLMRLMPASRNWRTVSGVSSGPHGDITARSPKSVAVRASS